MPQGKKAAIRVLAAVIAVAGMTAVPTAASMTAAAPAAATAVAGNDYPWSGATDCSAQFGIYSWCIGGDDISPLGFAYRNCTDYAAYELNEQMGGTVSNPKFSFSKFGFNSSDGNASGWRTAITAVLGSSAADSTPAVGAVAWWGSEVADGLGHVAIVAAVNYTGSGSVSSIVVDDYNQAGTGSYSSHTITPSSGWPDAFLHVADLSSGGVPATSGRPAAIQYGAEMDVFARGGDGNIWKDTWNGTAWSGFSSLGGGNLTGSPTAMVYTSGSYSEMDVYARGSDNHIYKDTWNGTSWSGFSSLGGSIASDPAAMQFNGSYSEMDIYGRGTNGDLLKDTWNGTSWSGWNDLGGSGNLAANPYAIQYNSEMDVFVRNTTGTVYKDTWNGTSWSGLNSLGGNMASSMDALQFNEGTYHELDVSAGSGSDGNVFKDTWNGSTWSGFSKLNSGGFGSAATPYAIQYNSELDVYDRGGSGQILKDTWNGSSWSGFNSLGGSMAGDPAALEFDEGSYHEMDVFAVGTGGSVYKDTWNGSSWSGFSPLR